MPDKITGTLEVGTNGRGEVVINHPDLQPDENGVGHIVFSPDQARGLARLLNKHADEADPPIPCPFRLGDKVTCLSGPQQYRAYCGIGTVVNVTRTRIVVQWQGNGRARNHTAKHLAPAQ